MAALSAVLWLAAGLLALGPVGVAVHRWRHGSRAVYCLAFGLTAVLALVALSHLLGGNGAATASLPVGLPWRGSTFRLDPLAAFFLLVVNLGGAAASLFAVGYGQHEPAPGRVLPFFPVFLGAMNVVLVADDAFAFLVSWESMSLASWALVLAHHREPGNTHAGYVYLVMASFGTLALLLAFGLLAGPAGGYGFAEMREATLGGGTAALVLMLALLGAGSKAGLVPLHVWLPLAHPAAPSHVSALMSGVMTKVAIYGFIRIVFDLSAEPEWWWGAILLVLGAGTAVLGVLHAVLERDLKRLLAYSTVENVGIVFIGLGLALAFEAAGHGLGAALGLTAALFHSLNHALFKSLLFLGAGAVLGATGERNIERLGGLIHRMPRTALAFLVGSAAISALPPLNGFASEWLAFQAILVSPDLTQWLLGFLVPAVGAMLALAAALAATAFVRAFGIVFLGRPRSPEAAAAHETDGFSLATMAALAALCLAAGVMPGLVIDALAPVVAELVGTALVAQAGNEWLTFVPIAAERSSYNGLVVLVFVALSGGLAAVVIHRTASHAVRRSDPWDCGFPDPSPSTQYTGGSFAQPIRRVFGSVAFRAVETVEMPPPGDVRPARFRVSLSDLAWEWLYSPVGDAVGAVSQRLNHIQFLTIRRYLTLVFAALILLLVGLSLWP